MDLGAITMLTKEEIAKKMWANLIKNSFEGEKIIIHGWRGMLPLTTMFQEEMIKESLNSINKIKDFIHNISEEKKELI